MLAIQNTAGLQAFSSVLSQALRRLKQYRTEGEWSAAILETAAQFSPAVALFNVDGKQLRLQGARGPELRPGLTLAIDDAQAFRAAIESKDTVVALRTASEVTAPLSSADLTSRALLLPILNGTRIVAVLFAAEEGTAEPLLLELLAGMGSLVLERASNTALNVQIATAPAGGGPALPVRSLPYWSGLDSQQQLLHIRAQRFARVKVAEMELLRPDACRAGREQSNVYLFLKKEIDAARDRYRDQFLARPGLEDYLHLELIRTIADGHEEKLGVDYPGQLG